MPRPRARRQISPEATEESRSGHGLRGTRRGKIAGFGSNFATGSPRSGAGDTASTPIAGGAAPLASVIVISSNVALRSQRAM